MAPPVKRKYTRSIVSIFVLIAILWGLGIWGHQRDIDAVNKRNLTKTEKEDKPKLFRLGLDLEGGLSIVLAPVAGQDAAVSSLDKAVDIIRNRIDALGVAEPDISVQGQNILIQLPGLKDPTTAIKLIGTTAKLAFRPVLQEVGPGAKLPSGVKDPNCVDQATWPKDVPDQPVVFCERQRDEAGVEAPRETWRKLLLAPVELQGDGVASANAEIPAGTGQWQVALKLNKEGSKKFGQVTAAACKKQGDQQRIAIVLDRVVESSPSVNADSCPGGITGGSAVISGSFNEKEAKDLALVLKYGALPVELERSTVTTISPTLGRESLQGGLLAGAIGLGVVLLYVLVFYRGLGLIIWVGLSVHAALTLVVVMILGQTAGFALSLAGIAGLIVSLGVAADSFIVYFERIKDEVHHGRTVRSSVDRAWGSAWRTIVAADLVTALAAGVLYLLAVGSVRGFALMLGLATFLDLFVSRLFMHPAVWLLAQTERFNKSKRLGFGSMAGATGSEPAIAGGGS